LFCVPEVLEESVARRYEVRLIGRTEEVVERFYAISAERRIRHPAVAAICDTARQELFGSASAPRRTPTVPRRN
jgi:LysR family transcriptional activator of nhaA